MSRYRYDRFEEPRYDRYEALDLIEQPTAQELAEDRATLVGVRNSHDFGGLVHPSDTGEVTPEWLKFTFDFHAKHGRVPTKNDFPF